MTEGWRSRYMRLRKEQKRVLSFVRSQRRQKKEMAILNRFVNRLEVGFSKLVQQAEEGRIRQRQIAERRIKRLLERNSWAASLFEILVEEKGSGKDSRLTIHFSKKEEHYAWALNTGSSYLLRTNWMEQDSHQMWKTYVQLTQVEDAFRIKKSDLGIWTIYHQRSDCTQSHILVWLFGSGDVVCIGAMDVQLRLRDHPKEPGRKIAGDPVPWSSFAIEG